MDNRSSQFLKTPDAAAYLSLSPSFLAKKRLTGDGPVFYKMGRSVVYSINALENYAAGNKRRSTSEAPPELIEQDLDGSPCSRPRARGWGTPHK
jgi:hypothetical protein